MSKMREFEIWSEGWVSSDGSGPARRLSTQTAESFDEACKKFIESDSEAKKYMYYNEERKQWIYWGCSIFDNATDAAKSFN